MKSGEWRMQNGERRQRDSQATRQPGADANKLAHYMLHWESARRETGPWSQTAGATIGA
jgi:hypothetical protein